MTKLQPLRSFSQNFLTDVRVAQKIVQALQIVPGDVVLEVGPGTGALTQHLVSSSCSSVHSVELDQRAVQAIQAQPWAASPKFRVVHADALTTSSAQQFPSVSRSHRKIIGNIPYSITSELLFWSFAQHTDVGRVVMMMQREVARRCVALPGTKDYGILSVAAWLHANAKILFHVQPGSFYPRPNVTSSVVAFDLLPITREPDHASEFLKFVRAAFSQRRKVMTNALAQWRSQRTGGVGSVSHAAGFDLAKTRAEQLEPPELLQVFRELVNG